MLDARCLILAAQMMKIVGWSRMGMGQAGGTWADVELLAGFGAGSKTNGLIINVVMRVKFELSMNSLMLKNK